MARHAMRRPSLRAKVIKPKQSKQAAPAKSEPAPAAGPSISFEAREVLPRSAKLLDIERQLKLTRTSTASLGKYDKKLDGESAREKGQRRQFESNEIDARTEKEKYLSILSALDTDKKVQKKIAGKDEHSDVVNARKAIRSASRGRGSANLAGEEKKNKITARKQGQGASKTKSAGKTKSSLSKGKRKGK